MKHDFNDAAKPIRFTRLGKAPTKAIREKRPPLDNYAVNNKKVVNLTTENLQTHAHWQARGDWAGVYDAAVWVRMPSGCQYPLQLALRYTDDSGEKSVAIDVFMPSDFSCALLTGSVKLEVVGQILDIGLYLVGAEEDLAANIEQWHLTAQIKR